MALAQELIATLNSEEESLNKRLKIADNVFRSAKFPLQNKEAVLLLWAGEVTKNNEIKVWELLHRWLTCDHLKEISRAHFKRSDVKELLHILIARTEALELLPENVKNVIVRCISELLDNKILRDFFLCDIESYYKLIVQILLKVNAPQLQLFLKKKHLFDNSLLLVEENAKFFIKFIIPTLGEIAFKFDGDEVIAEELSKVVQTFFFFRNSKNFEAFYHHILEQGEQQSLLPNLLFNRFPKFSKTPFCKQIFRLIFSAYVKSYGNRPEMIYKFLIVSTNYLGFYKEGFLDPNPANQNLSQVIVALNQFFEILSKQNVALDTKIHDVSFNDYIEELILSIIYYVKLAESDSFQLLQHIIAIDPLMIERNINRIIVFVLLSPNSCRHAVDETIRMIFEVFLKLHRIPNLISKMFPAIKEALREKESDYEPVIVFCGNHTTDLITNFNVNDILTENTLSYFMHCVTTLANWQIINVFKTLLFHLDKAIDKVVKKISKFYTIQSDQFQRLTIGILERDRKSVKWAKWCDGKLFYVDLVSVLLCRFLTSVKVAENTTPDAVIVKFVSAMEQLRGILEKFGKSLVHMKHNSTLMKVYLNICYYWGELYILLEYYSINKQVICKKSLDSDYSACNITYLHSYLNKEQWCLISERIANFGEKPCKEIMQKLFVQKLRAVLLFENTDGIELCSSLLTSLTLDLDENWEQLLAEDFIIEEIIAKMDFTNVLIIAELFIDHALQQDDFVNYLKNKSSLLNCQNLRNALLYVSLKRLNSNFKQKRKLDSHPKKCLSSRFFKNLPLDLFNGRSNDISQLIEFFNHELSIDNETISLKLNANKLNSNLDLIKELLITYSSNELILCAIMYLTTILIDLNHVDNDGVKSKTQLLIKGLLQNFSGSFRSIQCGLFSSKNLRDSQFFSDSLSLIIDILLKENNLKQLKEGLEIFLKELSNEEGLKCGLMIFNAFMKYKKSGKCLDKQLIGQYQLDTCKAMLNFMNDHQIEPEILTESYALLLKYALGNETMVITLDAILEHIEKIFDNVIKRCIESERITRGDIIFFTAVIRYRAKLKVGDNVVSKIWNTCKTSKINLNDFDGTAELIELIFEHIPNENFQEIAEGLLCFTLETMKGEEKENLSNCLRIWKAILACSFNSEKSKIWQKLLEKLLINILYSCLHCCPFWKQITELENNIIQTVHLVLTPALVDIVLVTISCIIKNKNGKFIDNFLLSHSIMDNLLKFRKQPLTDRLPAFLQQYRNLIEFLCKKSDADLNLTSDEIEEFSYCAHKIEQLTNNIVGCNKHIARLCPHLISGILKEYEKVTLLPNVKLHLNNCIYSLLSLCDPHAIAYTKRILSSASTEMFKIMYTNYKKYYKFTGKV